MRGADELAVRLFGAGPTERTGRAPGAVDRGELEACLARTRARLVPPVWAAAWAARQRLAGEEVLTEAASLGAASRV